MECIINFCNYDNNKEGAEDPVGSLEEHTPEKYIMTPKDWTFRDILSILKKILKLIEVYVDNFYSMV